MREPLSIAVGQAGVAKKMLRRMLRSESLRALFESYDEVDECALHADCLVFDITDPLANRRWRMFRAGRRMAGVIIVADGAVSLPPRLQARAVVLQKPLSPDSVAWGLRKLARLMNEAGMADGLRPVEASFSLPRLNLLRAADWLHGKRNGLTARYASMAEIRPDDEEHLRHLAFDPDEYLVGLLRNVLARDERAIFIRVPEGGIQLNPHVGIAMLYGDLLDVKALCGKRLKEFGSSLEVGGEELRSRIVPGQSPRHLSIEALLWLATLIAARGRFPDSLDITAPRRLARWPDLPRLLDAPYVARICALWTSDELNAFEVTSGLGIHQRHVFGFASAAHMLGLFATGSDGVARAAPDGGWLARRILSGTKVFSRVLRGVR